MLWRVSLGSTVTFTEFVAARTTVLELYDHTTWNPWIREEREHELHAAGLIHDQWERAEPDHHSETEAESRAWFARRRIDWQNKRKLEEQQRQARIPLCNAQRHHASLELLEDEASLRSATAHLAALRDGTWAPLMDPRKRVDEIADYEASIRDWQARVDQLREQVGDPETVIDKNGRLPSHRRTLGLAEFTSWRIREVRQLRALTAQLRSTLDAEPGHAERSQLRGQLASKELARQQLEAIPKLDAPAMCSQCPKPLSWHDNPYQLILPKGPCHTWPRYAQGRQQARELFFELTKKPAEPPAPRPKPLAVISSGLPLSQVMAHLAELQAQHPDAIVRRGYANKWELWPPDATP
ncbi:hypothetical protein SAMN04489729_6999 [Amycolatopsis lurida]|uniref:Uncharacterized protein n=1 Tax=Amycolatopsis lurida NRRL 2430 TaxID=1460371 RepID=A0A2P2FFA2_AMYLU|nr:hypothetical protein [Amycolatopsis lurida]KFU75407.1 hypothetical protein BB31_41615 [Amycolatopsis lurida NRRL 2430]SEE29970.1 hypothetical protein SAMN04489729_6999 [Amycolatopsis lurida]